MALSDNPKFPGVGPRREAFNTRMQNMGQQYNQYAGLTNSAVDYAMMQENVDLYAKQGSQANTAVSNLEIEAHSTLQNIFNDWFASGDTVESRDKNLLPEFFRTTPWFAGAENEAFDKYTKDLERKASVKQVDFLSAEDIFIIGGNEMLHDWWNQTDMAPKILGEGKWIDVFAPEAQIGVHEFEDGNFGLGFKPQVRTVDPESGDIWTADMTVDGGPEGTSESIGVVPIADLDEAMNNYKRENENLAGVVPAFARLPIYGEQFGGSSLFNRSASREDTLSAISDDPQSAIAAGRERETVLQGVLDTLPDIVREKQKKQQAEAIEEASIAQGAAIDAKEKAARDRERGYSTDLEPVEGDGWMQNKGQGLMGRFPNNPDESVMLHGSKLLEILPSYGVKALTNQLMGPDASLNKELTMPKSKSFAKVWENYIREAADIPFYMSYEQWNNDLTEEQRVEKIAAANELTQRSLARIVQTGIGRGEGDFLIDHKVGQVGGPKSLLGQKRIAVGEKGTVQDNDDLAAVMAFYKGEGKLTVGSKLREYFKSNPAAREEFKDDPYTFAMKYKDNLEALYGPEVTKEVEEEVLKPFLEATGDVDLDKFRTAVMNYTLGVDAVNAKKTINDMMTQAGNVTLEAEQALADHLSVIDGNAYNWGRDYREAITLQALQSLPIDNPRWKPMVDGLAMWVESGNWSDAQLKAQEQARLTTQFQYNVSKDIRDFQFQERKQTWQESNDLIQQISKATDLTQGGQDFVSQLTSPDLPRSGAINGRRGGPRYLRSLLDVMSGDLRTLAVWRGTLKSAKDRGIWGVQQENDYQRWGMETGVRFTEILNAMEGASRNAWQRFVAWLPFTPSGVPGHRTFDTMPSVVAFDKDSKPTDNINAVAYFQVMKADGVTLAGAGAKISVYGNINEELGAEGLQILMGWAEFGNAKYRENKK